MVIIGLLIALIAGIIPIAVIVLIISAIAKRNKDDKNNFDETIRNVYTYIILIVTLIAIISGVIATFRIGLDVILPEKSINSTYSTEQQDKNSNIIEFCTTLAMVISVVPVFVYHNNLAKKSREMKLEEKYNEKNIQQF